MGGANQYIQDTWGFLGEGTYNKVYVNKGRTCVLKLQKTFDTSLYDTDNPERSVRLWNEINSHINLPALLYRATDLDKQGKTVELHGWIAPFITGRQSTDGEISRELINIFNRTGRIIVDAPSPQNFITTRDRDVVCVDIGLALQMERREEDELGQITRPRKKSQESLNAWYDLNYDFSGSPESYFDSVKKTYPNTVQTIKALLFIKEHRPDIINVDFLKSNPLLLRQLSDAYGAYDTTVLDVTTPPTIDSINTACIVQLQRYIAAKIDQPKPNFLSRWFKNKMKTEKKIDAITNLITQLNRVQSVADIKESFAIMQQSLIAESRFTKGLRATFQRCFHIIDTFETHHPTLDRPPNTQN